MLAPLSFVLPYISIMSDPNEDYVHPTFSGEVYFTLTIQCDDLEANDKDELITEIRQAIARKLEGMPASVVFEDDDLSISNEEEDFMSKADRLYEQANDK
jgi:hypothetical protein